MEKKSSRTYPAIEGTWHIGRVGESALDVVITAMIFADINRSVVLDIDGDRKTWHIRIHHSIPKAVESDQALREYTTTALCELQKVFPEVRHDLRVVRRHRDSIAA